MVESIEDLRRICQAQHAKSDFRKEPFVGWYGYYFSRRTSIYITRLLVNARITPDQITWAHLIIANLGAILFLSQNYWHSVLAALFLHLSMILDSVDGELARYKSYKGARELNIEGTYLDFVGSFLVGGIIFFNIGLRVFLNPPYTLSVISLWLPRILSFIGSPLFILVLGFLASLCYILRWLSWSLAFIYTYADLRHLSPPDKDVEARKRAQVRYKSTIHKFEPVYTFVTHWHIIITIITVAAILDVLYIIPLFYGTILPLIWIAYVYLMFLQLRHKRGEKSVQCN